MTGTDPEVYMQQLEERTPAECVGCYIPILKARQLGNMITTGEMPLEHAEAEFDNSFKDCSFGLVADERDNRVRCASGLLCGSFVRGVTPRERQTELAKFGRASYPDLFS